MTAPRLVFDHVTKSFRDRTHPRVLRDAIPSAVGLLLGRPEPARSRFTAVDDVSFEVAPGEALGVIGRNGAGKSTTLKLAAGIYRPDSGTVRRGGRVAAMIELSAGFHPDLSGRENVHLSGALLGLRRKEVQRLLPDILEFAGIGAFVEAPLRVYSTGMVVRLGFAVAAYVPAEILLVDEVLAVGDIDFHAKCVDRMAQRRRENVSLLLVSHQLAVIEQFCDRAIFVDGGKKALEGAPVAVLDEYRRRMAALGSGPQESRDPAARSGSGDVRIVSVEVTGRGSDGGRIVAGSPFAVRLGFEAVRPGPSPSLGVEVHGLDGILIARAESPGDLSAHAAAGPGSAEVLFRRNALLPGAYVLTVFARDPAGHIDYDVQVKAHRFAVWGERTGGERGAVSLDPAWRR
jgi:ABC-type polysaccharide/polyol phosphate transport system ATPase subunit